MNRTQKATKVNKDTFDSLVSNSKVETINNSTNKSSIQGETLLDNTQAVFQRGNLIRNTNRASLDPTKCNNSNRNSNPGETLLLNNTQGSFHLICSTPRGSLDPTMYNSANRSSTPGETLLNNNQESY